MATEFGGSPEKKKVKIKNSTPDKQFSAATFDDVFPSTSSYLDKKKEQNFKELTELYNEISNEETTLTEELLQRKEDYVENSSQDPESSLHSNQSINENDDSSSTLDTQSLRTPHLKLKVVKLKYGESDEFKFVDFNNRLVTFCGECANCQRKQDCGKCRHCR